MSENSEKFQRILDECAAYLKLGYSVNFCLKKYPKTKSLKQPLTTVKAALQIPKKSIVLDKNSVWNKISEKISNKKEDFFKLFGKNSQFGVLKLAFSKNMLAIITIVMMISLLNSTAVAAQNSIPGETLYPIKRTVEKIQLTLTLNEVKKTEVRIKHAENRLTEVKAIIEKPTVPSDMAAEDQKAKAIESTITELVNATTQVADDSSTNKELLKKVVELTDKQELVLPGIEKKVEGETKKAVSNAIDNAVETKSVAERNLAQLETPPSASTSNSTSTDSQIKGAGTTSTSTQGTFNRKANSPTSTDDTLKKYGDPEATSTNLEIPVQDNTAETTTPQIIELK